MNNGNYVAVGDVSKLMFSRFDHDFFEGCWTPLVTRVLKVIEHENMRIAAAMAYLVRGWELQDPIDLFIAAFFVEEEIKHVST